MTVLWDGCCRTNMQLDNSGLGKQQLQKAISSEYSRNSFDSLLNNVLLYKCYLAISNQDLLKHMLNICRLKSYITYYILNWATGNCNLLHFQSTSGP